jgi:hypothetical protein
MICCIAHSCRWRCRRHSSSNHVGRELRDAHFSCGDGLVGGGLNRVEMGKAEQEWPRGGNEAMRAGQRDGVRHWRLCEGEWAGEKGVSLGRTSLRD